MNPTVFVVIVILLLGAIALIVAAGILLALWITKARRSR